VPGANLTHEEAIARAEIITRVDDYAIELDLTTGDEKFRSTTTVRFTARPGASSFIDLLDADVLSITLNGRHIPTSAYADSRIQLDDLQADNELTVVADCRYMNTGEGLHRFVDPVDNEVYLYSQCEVADARRIFPNFEQPDLKARMQLTVIAPARWVINANQPTPVPELTGDEVQIAPDRAAEPVAKWVFTPTPRLSTYLFAVVAGPYFETHSELTSSDGRTIPLGIFCRKSLAEYLDSDYIFDVTRKGFEFFEREFDYPYPFEKYDQLFVPEFNAGAMENPGCVTFTENYIFRGKVSESRRERKVMTILHEMAHMWFGDLVTMKWWDDLWLNESFAEFASTLATAEKTEWTQEWTTFNSMEKTWAYRQDALPSTHPIVAEVRDLEDVYTNFDGITYGKGASVLKQLVGWVGRKQFFAGLANYFKKYAYQNTVLNDLLRELEATSGRDLQSWSAAWLQTAGTNTLSPAMTVDLRKSPGTIRSFDAVQTAPEDHPTLRPHRFGLAFYDFDETGKNVVRTKEAWGDILGERTSITDFIGEKRPAFIMMNDEDLAFAKVRFDPDSMAFAVAHLSQFTDSLTRAVIWGALWDAVRNGELPAPEFAKTVLTHIMGETETTTIGTLLGQLGTAVTTYADPQQRAAAREQAADEVWRLAQQAKPDSDLQFQLLRAFASLACTPAQGKILRGLLDGTITLPGVEVDTDLRWDLLQGLVELGGTDEAEIAATLAKDATNNGREAAARARASLPTTEAKRQAFEMVVKDPEVPNGIARAVATGFRSVTDPVILEPLVDDYLGALNDIWNTRSYHMASELTQGFYPGPLASAELRDRVQGWLDDNPDAAHSLRRFLQEGLDDTKRALRAQALSAKAR